MLIDCHCFSTWLSPITVMDEETIISQGVCVCVCVWTFKIMFKSKQYFWKIIVIKTSKSVPEEWHQYSQIYLDCNFSHYNPKKCFMLTFVVVNNYNIYYCFSVFIFSHFPQLTWEYGQHLRFKPRADTAGRIRSRDENRETVGMKSSNSTGDANEHAMWKIHPQTPSCVSAGIAPLSIFMWEAHLYQRWINSPTKTRGLSAKMEHQPQHGSDSEWAVFYWSAWSLTAWVAVVRGNANFPSVYLNWGEETEYRPEESSLFLPR